MTDKTIDYDLLNSLSQKYSGAIPRYTSYPTAVELKECSNLESVEQILKLHGQSGNPVSLYVHLPHCSGLCYFCACNKIVTTDPDAKMTYLENLRKECSRLREAAGSKISIDEIHLGGGSPSYLSLEELETLCQILDDSFLFAGTEKSIEVDPRNFDRDKAQLLYDHGFRRASLGVQDFDPHVQKTVNRIQPFSLTEGTVTYLREIGFKSINIDLIYGLPEQTLEGFENTFKQTAILRPERIALYGYAHVSWKIKVQKIFDKYDLPNPSERLRLFHSGVKIFENAGYEYVGLDHFALPDDELLHAYRAGKLKRNFMGYTIARGAGTLGIGISSISDIEGCLYQNFVKAEDYQKALAADQLPVAKIFKRSREDTIRARLIERLMCDSKINLQNLFGQDDQEAARIFAEERGRLKPLEEDGLVNLRDDDSIIVTRLGRFFVRNIASMFDTYLSGHQKSSGTTFSQAV